MQIKPAQSSPPPGRKYGFCALKIAMKCHFDTDKSYYQKY